MAAAYSRGVSAKALKVLGATEEEVRLERALIVSLDSPSTNPSERIFVEMSPEDAAPAPTDAQGKAEKALGVPEGQNLQWLQRQSSNNITRKRLSSKALATLGATIDDVRIEKALLVLGEAPGREIPGGKLPRPRDPYEFDDPTWAVPPPGAAAPTGLSIFLCAFLPWGILGPLNVLKLQLNKVSPGAHLWVPLETEQCQAACGIARMWASLFWSMQFANAVACVYLHYNRERGLALLAVSHKLVVGGLLLKAYLGGVVYWPIGLFGACCEWFFAAGFIQQLRRP